jgi:hypothetical protein
MNSNLTPRAFFPRDQLPTAKLPPFVQNDCFQPSSLPRDSNQKANIHSCPFRKTYPLFRGSRARIDYWIGYQAHSPEPRIVNSLRRRSSQPQPSANWSGVEAVSHCLGENLWLASPVLFGGNNDGDRVTDNAVYPSSGQVVFLIE